MRLPYNVRPQRSVPAQIVGRFPVGDAVSVPTKTRKVKSLPYRNSASPGSICQSGSDYTAIGALIDGCGL